MASSDSRRDPDAPDVLDTAEAGGMALRGGALRSAGYVAGIVLTLGSAPLLVRHLGQARFGQYSAVVALIAIVSGLTEGGINSIALREFATHKGLERDHLMANLLGIRLAASAVGVSAAVGFAALAGYGSTLVAGTAIAGLGMVLAVTQSMLSMALQGELKFGLVAATEFGRQVVTVSLIVIAAIAGSGIVGFLATALPAAAFALAATALFVRGVVPLRPRFDLAEWGGLLVDTLPFAAAVALNSLYFRLALIVMSIEATKVQTGYFATSFRIVEVTIAIPALILGAAFPIISRAASADPERFASASRRMFELSLIVGAWIALSMELAASFAIDVIGGDEAKPAAAVLRIQAPAVMATFVAVACGFILLALRRHRAVLNANVAALAFAGVLALVLIPSHGAHGAAVAALGAEVVLAIASAWLLLRSPGIHGLPLADVPLVLGAAALAGGLAVALPVHALVRVVIASALFALALRTIGRFPPELRELLTRRRPS